MQPNNAIMHYIPWRKVQTAERYAHQTRRSRFSTEIYESLKSVQVCKLRQGQTNARSVFAAKLIKRHTWGGSRDGPQNMAATTASKAQMKGTLRAIDNYGAGKSKVPRACATGALPHVATEWSVKVHRQWRASINDASSG